MQDGKVPEGFVQLVKLVMKEQPLSSFGPKADSDIWAQFLRVALLGGSRSDAEISYLLEAFGRALGFGYVLGANHTFITCFSKLGDFPLFISGSVIASFLFADLRIGRVSRDSESQNRSLHLSPFLPGFLNPTHPNNKGACNEERLADVRRGSGDLVDPRAVGRRR